MLELEQFRRLYQQWEQAIQTGNLSFERHQHVQTLCFYQQSIRLSEELLALDCVSRRAIAALLVSYHNLADFYIREKAHNLAQEALEDACACMADLANSSPSHEHILWGLHTADKKRYLFEQQHYGTAMYSGSLTPGCQQQTYHTRPIH